MSHVILHTEAALGLGGQELRILTEVRWLLDHGWSALIVCQPASRLLAEVGAAGLPAVALPMRSAWEVPAFLSLRKLIRAHDIALVHTHSSIDSWLATLAARSLGVPVVRSRHVAIPIPRRRALIYHLAARILTSGEHIRAVVVRAGVTPQKIISIPAGIDTSLFHPGVSGASVREEFGLAGPIVGLVANVRGSKGHRFFLEAAQEVTRAEPAARFLIVGDGVGYDDVRRRVREMGLEPYVIMTGFRRDIPAIMAALDVLVLPSIRSEATSQVIPQALAVETPVVATDTGGIGEIVSDGETGRLVPPADGHALAEAILALLHDPARARAMARAGRSLVLERYSVAAMMERTTAVYRELLTTAV